MRDLAELMIFEEKWLQHGRCSGRPYRDALCVETE